MKLGERTKIGACPYFPIHLGKRVVGCGPSNVFIRPVKTGLWTSCNDPLASYKERSVM